MKFQSSKKVWFTKEYMKKLLSSFYTLSRTYFCPNFIKIEN